MKLYFAGLLLMALWGLIFLAIYRFFFPREEPASLPPKGWKLRCVGSSVFVNFEIFDEKQNFHGRLSLRATQLRAFIRAWPGSIDWNWYPNPEDAG